MVVAFIIIAIDFFLKQIKQKIKSYHLYHRTNFFRRNARPIVLTLPLAHPKPKTAFVASDKMIDKKNDQ
ncbi:MAG: hypothetical protein QM529_03120 [Hydrotalea sp.]|nr:hypothetical protein [Hydrotalea sp.]